MPRLAFVFAPAMFGLLAAAALFAGLGVVPPWTAGFLYLSLAVAVFAALCIADGDFTLRRLGTALIAVIVLAGAVLLHGTAAHAQAIAAPAGDTGLWAFANGYLAPAAVTVATGAVTWAAARFHQWTGVKMSAELTADVRETAITGLYLAAHEAEVAIDRNLPAEKRAELIGDAVRWVMARLPGPLAWLGFAEPVVEGIVVKMLGQIIAGAPADPVAVVSGTVAPLGLDPSGFLSGAEAAVAGLAAGVLPAPKA